MLPPFFASLPQRLRWALGMSLVVLLVPPGRAWAQTWELLARTQADQYASGLGGVAVAANGDVVVTGGLSGTMTLGAAGSIGTQGYGGGFVARRSAAGQWLWATILDCPYNTTVGRPLVLPDNDILVLGIFTDGSAGTTFGNLTTLFGEGTYDGYVGRLDGATGRWRWVAQLATRGAFTHTRPMAMALRPGGDLVVTGTYNGQMQLGSLPLLVTNRPGGFGTSNFDLFVARLDIATGRWLQAFGAGGQGEDEATGIVALPNGDVALTGTLNAPLTLGTLPAIGGPAGSRAFAARLDPVSQQWRWVQQAIADTLAQGQCIATLPNGDLAIDGKYRGTARCGPFTLGRGADQYSAFVGRLNGTDGQWIWASSGGGTSWPGTGGLATTPNGDIVVSSTFSGPGRFGALPLVRSASKGPDIYVGQLDGANGHWQWLTTGGGDGGGTSQYTSADHDGAGEIIALDNQHLLTVGIFSAGARLGPAIGPLLTRGYGGKGQDGYLARITTPAPCPDSAAAPVGLSIIYDSTYCGPGIRLAVSGAPAGSAFAWNTGAGSQSIVVQAPGRYTVRVNTLAGCRHRLSSVQTQVDFPSTVPFPNIITPNGDGLNDYWKVARLPANTRLRIFNRWGQLVYQTAAYANNWSANGAPGGLYYYVLSNKLLCPNTQVKGWIEVVR